MTELLIGLSLGFGAGFSPGPLMTLVMTTTLQRGLLAGARVACTPLITDAPIILLCVFVLRSLPAGLVPLLGTIGGLFVVYLGVHTWREVRHVTLEVPVTIGADRQDLLRGVVVNLLSPSPWVFWLGVGVPTLMKAWAVAPGRGLAFLIGFFALLVGGKFVVAAALAVGRRWMTLRVYRGVLMIGAVVLLLTGLALLREAFRAWFGV